MAQNRRSIDLISQVMATDIVVGLFEGEIKNIQEGLCLIEERVIIKMLDECRENQSEAARRLGMSRGALIYKLKRIKERAG